MSLLTVFNCDKKKRYGKQSDGGYVIAELDGGYDCYISAGVDDEEGFSRDFLEANKIDKKDCFAFDGTVEDYPFEFTTNINFIKKNIGVDNTSDQTNLTFLTEKYNNIFLKMDIEGCEFEWINSLSSDDIRKFKQIVIEFHDILEDTLNVSMFEKHKSFAKLMETHYIVHAHGNNHGRVYICEYDDNGIRKTHKMPQVIELTYVRKDCFENEPSKNTRPLPDPTLDYPNTPFCIDIDLNYYPFVFNTVNNK